MLLATRLVFILHRGKPMIFKVQILLPDILTYIESFLADKAYDAAERVLDLLKNAGVRAVIPPKSNRKEPREYDEEMYKARHLIENFFAKLKQYRAIATRYDKRASTFLRGIHLAAAIIWPNWPHTLVKFYYLYSNNYHYHFINFIRIISLIRICSVKQFLYLCVTAEK